MAVPWAAIAAAVQAAATMGSGIMGRNATRRQNRRSRSQDARHASQVDPFVTALQNFDTSPLRDFDTSALKDFDADELREFAAEMQRQGQEGPTLGRIGTGALRNAPTNLDLSRLRESDTTGLEAAAQRRLRDQRGALDAQLASRGTYNTGRSNIAQRQLQADVMSQLAGDINQDQFQREQTALGFERGGQQLKAQNLAEALGLGVRQRGQDLQSMDRRAGLSGDFLAEALGLEQRGLETGLGMDLDALGQALGLDLTATQSAGQMVMNTPGYADWNREEEAFQEGVDAWDLQGMEEEETTGGGPGGGPGGGGPGSGGGGYTAGPGSVGGGNFTGGAYADIPGPADSRPYDTGATSVPPNIGPGQSSGGLPPHIGPSPEARPTPGPRIPRGQEFRGRNLRSRRGGRQGFAMGGGGSAGLDILGQAAPILRGAQGAVGGPEGISGFRMPGQGGMGDARDFRGGGGDGSAFGVQGSLQDIFGGGGGGGQNQFSPEMLSGLMQALGNLGGGQGGAGMGGFSQGFNANRNRRATRRRRNWMV